ncbi:solute carrier family 15 member 2 isoform X2 [Genypterus blacodes]|uniref:solute carrier family 15 member 2 isoform X2 n=1 Tax=Genypterus blacodes TaxID=154954 RepID=UPI003F75FF49
MDRKFCGTNYPLSICFIVVNEFCERFSYYGMKAVLTLYFLNYLHWDENLSTAIYHAFSSLCYFTPVLGAVIADAWLGKFKTIIYLSIVYVIGHVVKSVGAIPIVGNSDVHVALSILGLILIAFGTGGIKPCVAAFGGDQFDEQHSRERQKFFSIFYMSINAGSLLSTLITPILRVVFGAGSALYKKTPPQGNIFLEVCNCIGFAINSRWRRSKCDSQRNHWLDWAEEKYSKRLIQEIKMVLRILVLYIPLPMFWALFDQQGSRWTLQANRMNMALGKSFTVKPDQMQILNPLLILLFIPIFDLIIYPLVGLCGFKITPLRKMAAGMIFAALAFGAAAIVELKVVDTVVTPAPEGKCLLQVFNLASKNVSLQIPGSDMFPLPIQRLQDPAKYVTLPLEGPTKNLTMTVTSDGTKYKCRQMFEQKTANSLILYPEPPGIQCKLVEDNIKKNENGNPLIRFINTQPEAINLTIGDVGLHVPPGYNISSYMIVQQKEYPDVSCSMESKQCSNLDLGLLDFGASYTVILTEEAGKIVAHKMEDVKANNVHITWQIPQYVLITVGEVMFSITGLEFSYSQAPASMKSVLQACWLLTVAVGNVIVLIVAEGAGLEQWKEFVLFAGLLLGVCIIFSIMAHFYTYIDPNQVDMICLENTAGKEDDDNSEDNMKMKTSDVHSNILEQRF